VSHSALGTAVAILILTVGFAAPAAIPPPGAHGNAPSSGLPSAGAGLTGVLPNDHIHHVVTVMMENHDYDSYFGTYCQTKGPYCSVTGNGIPPGTCVPYYPTDPSAGCVVPFNMTPANFTINDMEHDWYSGPIAIDGGAMDGFYDAEGTTNTFGHYNGSTIPIYWDMAEEYASADNFWGANLSYSLPNHWYLVSATTPPIAYDTYMGWDGVQSTYLDEANNTSTIEDLLVAHNTSWRYYDTSLEAYSQAVNGGRSMVGRVDIHRTGLEQPRRHIDWSLGRQGDGDGVAGPAVNLVTPVVEHDNREVGLAAKIGDLDAIDVIAG